MTTEELKSLMRIPADADKSEIQNRFDSIAKVLMNDCVICYDDNEYRILDIEFYFYNKKHQDITVHPRKSEALCWYINDFGGVDLNFESRIERDENCFFKYRLTNESYYGGILIRQIQRISDNYVFDGPLKVAELFRTLDATSPQQNTPILKIRHQSDSNIELGISPETTGMLEEKCDKRRNILGTHKGMSPEEQIKKKVNYNLQQCFTTYDVPKHTLEEELKTFIDAPYRYFRKNK